MATAIAGPTAGLAERNESIVEKVADEDELRKMSESGNHPGIRERMWGLHARLDKTVTYEEFHFWAKVEREMEKEENRTYRELTHSRGLMGNVKAYFTTDAYAAAKLTAEAHADDQVIADSDEKQPHMTADGTISPVAPSRTHDYDAKWRTQSRAMRTAGWVSMFYLITTDILGWGACPYVFSNTGYNYGFGIFALMGVCAGASAFMIWRTFLALDSSRYPMVSFSDPFFRLGGSTLRHIINVLQAIQLLMTVCVILLGQTNLLAQMAATNIDFCFIAAGIIVLAVSMLGTLVRSLKHMGWICNFTVWFNIVQFIIIMAASSKNGADPTPQIANGRLPQAWIKNPVPVVTFWQPVPEMYRPSTAGSFSTLFNGISSMVYSYSGAIFFIAFLSEMRNPNDFWKAVFLAQSFITAVYMVFGGYVYSRYGQYAFSTITQVVQPYVLQTVVNTFAMISGTLTTFLYFNIAMKNVYLEVGEAIFNLPPISTSTGRKLWYSLGPIYWIIAFVIAMSVPYFSAFVNFIGSLFGLNFTYSLPAIMYIMFKTKEGATLEGEGFDPATGVTTVHDRGIKRWVRGYFKNALFTVPATAFALCGLAASGMGTWANILGLEAAAAQAAFISWTCNNPYFTG